MRFYEKKTEHFQNRPYSTLNKSFEKYKPSLIIEIEQRHHKNIQIESVFNSFEEQGYNCFYYSKKESQLFSFENKTYLTNTKDYFGKIDYINNYIFIHSNNTTIKSVDVINKEIAIKTKH